MVAVVSIVSAWTPLPVHGQAKEKPAPEEKTGLKVGSKAPDFTLKNQDGNEVSLVDLRKKGPIALVFHRSADW